MLAALGSLQDSVPPMPPEEVPQRIRDAFGMEPDEAFVSFELEPFASASIGQLHHATLRDPETGELYEAAVKLQRYGLLDALEPTLRTARLVSAVTAEVIRTGPGFEPEKRDELIKIVEMVDRTLEGFVKTFEVETDYLREAKTMRDYAGVVDGFAGIRVPQVYDSHSNGTVLAMELVKGERLDALLARYEQAHAARQQPAREVRLRKGSEDADALAAASQFAERAYGLTPVSSRVVAQRRLRGREVELFFDHKSMPSVRVKVDRNGRVKALTPVAELTPAAIDKLRARLASWFVSSPLQSGTMHGDIHQGNFFILPDLSVTIIDYGMMLDIGKRELLRVGHFVSAGRKQSAAGMAAELVHMLEGAPTGRAELRELKKRLRVSLERELAVVSPNSSAVAFVAAAFRAAGHEGMQIDPLYLQLVKTASSMGGNLAAFEASSDVPGGPREVISDVVPGAGKNLLGTFVSGVGAHRSHRKVEVLEALRTQFATPRPDGP
ncbi:MAG: phosphotransferase [Archangiaceae bacterium]|nr:phosphotransferase [Archangiaceae bacterium]